MNSLVLLILGIAIVLLAREFNPGKKEKSYSSNNKRLNLNKATYGKLVSIK